MKDKDLYAQILGIESPWKASDIELDLSAGEWPSMLSRRKEPSIVVRPAERFHQAMIHDSVSGDTWTPVNTSASWLYRF